MQRIIFLKIMLVSFMIIKIDVGTARSGFDQPSYGSSFTRLTGFSPTAILVPGYLPWGFLPWSTGITAHVI